MAHMIEPLIEVVTKTIDPLRERNILFRIFASRKVWMALSAVAGCVVVVAGADPEKWTPLITAIVTLAISVIAGISYEDGKEKSAGGPGGQIVPSLLAALLAAGLLLAGGCAAKSPAARWASARDALTRVQETVLLQHRIGNVSDEDLIALDQIVRGVRASLDRAAGELPSGGPAFETYLNLAERVLDELIESQSKTKMEAGHDGSGHSRAGEIGDVAHAVLLAAGRDRATGRPDQRRAVGGDPASGRRLGRRLGRGGDGGEVARWDGRTYGRRQVRASNLIAA